MGPYERWLQQHYAQVHKRMQGKVSPPPRQSPPVEPEPPPAPPPPEPERQQLEPLSPVAFWAAHTHDRVRVIQRAVAWRYHIKLADLCGPRRPGHVTIPRQLAMFLMYTLWPGKWSTPQIGRRFGNRDHTTVLNGIERTRARMADPDFAAMVNELEAEIRKAVDDALHYSDQSEKAGAA